MGSLEGKLSQIGEVVLLTAAQNYFSALNGGLQKDLATSITMKQAYLSKYEVVGELRATLREGFLETPDAKSILKSEEIQVAQDLLSPEKPILDIAGTPANFDVLQGFIQRIAKNAPGAFDPTLFQPFSSLMHDKVYPVPSQELDLDVRRYGRYIGFEKFPKNIFDWLAKNSTLYGFILYQDYGLYYVGFETLKKLSSNATMLGKQVNRFQKKTEQIGGISAIASKLASAKDPVVGEADLVTTSIPVQENSGATPVLVAIGTAGQVISLDTYTKYVPMQIASKAAGIKLQCNSGFRPATGNARVTWTSAGGKKGSFSPQEFLRRTYSISKGHKDYKKFWGKNSVCAGGKWGQKCGTEAFIFYAASSAWSNPVGKPGFSKHGSNKAVDLNTGTRKKKGRKINVPVYTWLAQNSYKFGFVRTCRSEEWHHEYNPSKAAKGPYGGVPNGNKNLWYTDLGLDKLA